MEQGHFQTSQDPDQISQPHCVEEIREERESTWDKFSIVKYPLSSESAIKTIEDQNTLVFIVDKRARKPAIRKACQELYNIKVAKVNTLITPKGNKKAYVVLSKAHDALEIANKIGIM